MIGLPAHAPGCDLCATRSGHAFRADFTMAFQPVVNTATGAIFAQEALVRPVGDGSAWDIIRHVTDETRYSFDQQCRKRAIEIAARLRLGTRLSINFNPNAVYEPEHCIRATLWAAERHRFPIEKIIFEFTESEAVRDVKHLTHIVDSYRSQGFMTAIDDFGAGYAGMGMLCEVAPDLVKIDMSLLRGIDASPRRRTIVRAIQRLCEDLHISPVAEGVETAAEAAVLNDMGITLQQGYHYARPAYERLVQGSEIAVSARSPAPDRTRRSA